jgi:hypothetical protein
LERRDFLKTLGMALGGAILSTGCGSDGRIGTDSNPLPNGFRFFRLVSSGDTLPGGGSVSSLPGSVHINDQNEILFHAQAPDKTMGVYRLTMDYSDSFRPQVVEDVALVRDGDTLSDGFKVTHTYLCATNSRGSFAASVTRDDGTNGIYVLRNGQFEPAATFMTRTPDDAGTIGANIGDFRLRANDDLLAVCHHSPDGDVHPKESLFVFNGGRSDGSGLSLLEQGSLIPDTGTPLGRIGLIDVMPHGDDFVSQVFAETPNVNPRGVDGSPKMPSAVLHGRLSQPRSGGERLMAVSPRLPMTSSIRGRTTQGEVFYGPRISSDGRVAQIVHQSDDQLALFSDSSLLATTGGPTPNGNTLTGFSGPLWAPGGLLYVSLYTNAGDELSVTGGGLPATVLSRGDRIEGKTVEGLGFGVVRDQIDSAGRLVMGVEFEDSSQSVVLGVPF